MYNLSKLSQKKYNLMKATAGKEKLKGGLGDGKTDKDFDPKQLEDGFEVEKEHSTDKQVRKEIARDHLTEDPNYYKKLKKMETKEAQLNGDSPVNEVRPEDEINTTNNLDHDLEIYRSMGKTIPNNIKRRLNAKIHNLISPDFKTKFFDAIPLQDIFDILNSEGLVPLQEDNTYWSGFLIGRDANATFPLAFSSTKDSNGEYMPTENGFLFLSWYKMDATGRYEINCYLS